MDDSRRDWIIADVIWIIADVIWIIADVIWIIADTIGRLSNGSGAKGVEDAKSHSAYDIKLSYRISNKKSADVLREN